MSIGSFLALLSLPRVAASFWTAADEQKFARLRAQGLDIAELRLDMAGDELEVEGACELLRGYAKLPRIATVRWSEEGGKWKKSERQRRDMLCGALPESEAVDVELAAKIYSETAAEILAAGVVLIASRHNFSGVDSLEVLEESARRAFDSGAHIFKVANMVETMDDLEILRAFIRKWRSYSIIVTGMGSGDIARLAREEMPRLGSRVSYSAVGEESSAPGQLTLAETAAAVKEAHENW